MKPMSDPKRRNITPDEWRLLPPDVTAIVDFGTFDYEGVAIHATAAVGPKAPLPASVFMV